MALVTVNSPHDCCIAKSVTRTAPGSHTRARVKVPQTGTKKRISVKENTQIMITWEDVLLVRVSKLRESKLLLSDELT